MSTLSWSKLWTLCHNIFGHICDVLPAVWRHVDVLSQDFSQHVCDVQPAFQRSVDVSSHCFWTFCDVLPPAQQTVDVLLQDFFNTFAMSSRLFSEMWTFVTPISAHLWCTAACSANCGRFVTGYMKIYWWRCQKEKSKKSHETVPLRISCHTWKWAEICEFFRKMDLLLCWDEMSQQSWMKNTRTKCHRLWDKILHCDSLSHCDKPSKFTRSECHNLGWTENLSTVVKCHSRLFVGWTDSVDRNVTWSVCGWADRQCTLAP